MVHPQRDTEAEWQVGKQPPPIQVHTSQVFLDPELQDFFVDLTRLINYTVRTDVRLFVILNKESGVSLICFECQLKAELLSSLEGVTDKNTGQPIFKELDWFTYKVSCVMYSDSVCEHSWSIERWIHSKRRNGLSQESVERFLHTNTNLVLRESLNVVLHHLLPWDIELVIDCSSRNPRCPNMVNTQCIPLRKIESG
jgi:hypothetical protein